jgi:2-polyprenyl-3-methyl-5-hydroxy-6-metoxy-1,4-benzoquinol methylase
MNQINGRRGRNLHRVRLLALFFIAALVSMSAPFSGPAPSPAPSQAPPPTQLQTAAPAGDEQVWKDFIAWFKKAPADADAFRLYGEELARQGLTKEEIGRRFGVITRLFAVKPEGAEVFYDRTFGRPALTGRPEVDGFASVPSEFLVGAVKDVRPGRALDLGMGQGRNAVALAAKGWTVTGVDVSGEAIAAAARNADTAGVKVTGVKSDYASFDLGKEAWDLVVMVFAWAPIDDPAFVERVKASLKPGGLVILENFVSTPERPHAPMVRALPPGATREALAGFEIVSYEEINGTGDWGGPGSNLVRTVARKR